MSFSHPYCPGQGDLPGYNPYEGMSDGFDDIPFCEKCATRFGERHWRELVYCEKHDHWYCDHCNWEGCDKCEDEEIDRSMAEEEAADL